MPVACDADWTTLHRLIGHAGGETPSHTDNEDIVKKMESFISGASATSGASRANDLHPRKRKPLTEPVTATHKKAKVTQKSTREIVAVVSGSC